MNEITIGIIGTDTSHATVFTDLLNNPDNPQYVPGGKVIAAYPGGSPDIPVSRERIDEFTQTLIGKYAVEMCSSVEEVAEKVDAILIESVDGRAHLEQFRKVAGFGKPVFIDKPFTVSTEEAIKIRDLARGENVPIFSSSGLRYDINICKALAQEESGQVIGAETYGPAEYIEGVSGLFWYGIHAAEMLFAAMGPGCEVVRCIGNDDADVVVGRWSDGRIGTLRGIRKGKADFGCVLYRENAIEDVKTTGDASFYSGLVQSIMDFFKTGKSPVNIDTTVEIIAFLQAANNSKESGGKEIPCSVG